MAIERTDVTHIRPDAQLWVLEVLDDDDGTYHRRVVEPGDDPDAERDPGVAALMRTRHTPAVVGRFRDAREAVRERDRGD
jgi:hypothetical protein